MMNYHISMSCLPESIRIMSLLSQQIGFVRCCASTTWNAWETPTLFRHIFFLQRSTCNSVSRGCWWTKLELSVWAIKICMFLIWNPSIVWDAPNRVNPVFHWLNSENPFMISNKIDFNQMLWKTFWRIRRQRPPSIDPQDCGPLFSIFSFPPDVYLTT